MKTLDTAIGCFEIDNLAMGYQLLNLITQTQDVEVIEASPMGAQKFLLILGAEKKVLETVYEEIAAHTGNVGQAHILDHEIIEKPHANLLSAFYSLAQQELSQSLVVVQTDSVSGILSIGNFVLSFHKLAPIEIKIFRGQPSTCLGFFTGSAEECMLAAEEARAKLKSSLREGRVELIESPKPSFREFFNLSGNT